MLVIGLVGGIASGKSFVSQLLQDLGARALDADAAAHAVLLEPEVKQAVRDRWGDAVFNEDGDVDRAALAEIVFAPPPTGPPELQHLEGISHPRIARRLQRHIEDSHKSGCPALVMDAAVMMKSGWDKYCDVVIFVDAPRGLRLQRARGRGWTEEQFSAREAAQTPLAEKRRRADVLIDNSGTAADVTKQLEHFWRERIPPQDKSPTPTDATSKTAPEKSN